MNKLRGHCYFCGDPVYADAGTLITFARVPGKEPLPTHKKCRKEFKRPKR